MAESFFQYKKVWYYFEITTAVENWNNDLIGHGNLFETSPHLKYQGEIPGQR